MIDYIPFAILAVLLFGILGLYATIVATAYFENRYEDSNGEAAPFSPYDATILRINSALRQNCSPYWNQDGIANVDIVGLDVCSTNRELSHRVVEDYVNAGWLVEYRVPTNTYTFSLSDA